MEILTLEFEKEMKLYVNKHEVTLKCFKTDEHGNIKFGVDAPRTISVDREEIFEMKKVTGDFLRVNNE